MKKIILSIIAATALFTSCKKDPTEPAPAVATTGSLAVEFENMVDTNVLTLNTVNYLNANGDTFTVSKFNYFISNVKLTKSDYTVYPVPESYYLIQESVSSSKTITLPNIPYGTYSSISFIIGVDSTRNVSGAQTGALDQATGMFWSWTSGYIMAKFEGTSPQSPATNHALTFHVGGFSGVNSVLTPVNLSFNGSTANVSGTVTPRIHMKADLSQWFKIPTSINFATTHTIHMPGATAKSIANNYADMFSVEHIHN